MTGNKTRYDEDSQRTRLGRNGDEPVISDIHAAREAVRSWQGSSTLG